MFLLFAFSRLDCQRRLLASTALVSAVGCFIAAAPVLANPIGGQVVGGGATIVQTSPTREDIDQSSSKAIINWQGFSINQGEQVNFNQPSSSAIALNRVTGGDASKIAGQLTANGQVWLVNPNGVFFGRTAQVNVGGLVATTSDISDKNFMAGNYVFDKPGNPNARVVNDGNITVAQAGMAALVAPNVRNSGVIEAKLGKVALASGNEYTLDLYGDGLVKFAVDDQTAASLKRASVSNTGSIDADGGTVLLTASQAAGVVDNAINVGGTVTARTTDQGPGAIVVDSGGGTATVRGTLDASGYGAGQSGGTVQVLGDKVNLTKTASIDVSGDAGGGTVLVGGNFHGAGPQRNATRTTVAKGATIKANAITRGNGGEVAIWSKQSTRFDGTIEARGGAQGGDGGMVETSGASLGVGMDALVDTGAPQGTVGTWLLDPQNIDVVSGMPSGDETAASTIVTNLDTSNVTLQAGNEIDINGAIDSSGNANTHNLTLEAGESIAINAGIKLNGSFSATANDSADVNNTTMLAADRGTDSGNFAMLLGTSIDVRTAPGQSIEITIGPSVANPGTGGYYAPGAVQLAGLNTGTGTLTVGGYASFIGQTDDGLKVGGAASFATASPNADVTLGAANNAFRGSVSLTGAGVTLVNSTATTLGASTVNGNLSVTAQSGDIGESGPMTVFGTADFNAPAGNVTLTDANNQFSDTVSINSAGNVGFTNDAGVTNLGNVTAPGTLTVESKAGTILQTTGDAVQAGASSFTSDNPGSSVTLGNGGNRLAGTITLNTPGDATLVNTVATDLGTSSAGGNFFVTSGGDITQSGPLSVGGTASFTAASPGASIALKNAANKFIGKVSLIASLDASLVNSIATQLGASVTGRSLTVTSGGAVTADDPLQVGWATTISGGSITLDNSGNALNGPISFNTPGDASVVNEDPITFGNSFVGGSLSLNSENGGVTFDGPSTVDGNLSVAAQNGNITENPNDPSPLTVFGTVDMTAAAPEANITLNDPGNQLSDTVNLVASNNISLTNNAGDTNLGNVTAGGALTVDSQAGTIFQTAGDAVQAGGAASFSSDNPSSNVLLGNAGNALAGPVTLRASDNIDLTNSVPTTLDQARAGGALTVEVTNGNLTQTSTGMLQSGWAASFTTDAPNATITLNNPSNAFAGPISVNTTGSGGDVALANNADTTLTNSSVGGALNIKAENHALNLFSDLSVTSLAASGSNVTNVDSSTNTTYRIAVANGGPAGTLGDRGDLENVTVGGVGGAGVARDFRLTAAAVGNFTINGSMGQSYTPPPAPQIPSPNPAPFAEPQVQSAPSVTSGDAAVVEGIAPLLALSDEKNGGAGGTVGNAPGAGTGGADAIFAPLAEQISQVEDDFATTALLQSELAAQPGTPQSPDACSGSDKNLVVCIPGTQSAQSPE